MNISVALPIALNKTFDYALPPALAQKARKGLRVKVPFGPAMQTGFITALNTSPNLPKNIKLKEVSEILDSQIYYGPELFPLAEFIEKTYANTLGETLNVLVPPFLNDKLLAKYTPAPPADLPLFYPAGPLTGSQKAAIAAANSNQINLFYGDTFTGKGEAALNITHKYLMEGGQVLMLVPDVIISAELIANVQKKFGAANIHMWHSKVPLAKRKTAVADIFTGRPCVVIGTRSACLLPFKNLKLSIIFHEEDEAYKQEDNKPYYHSRDVLIERGKMNDSKLIMVSATPSLETLLMMQQGRLSAVEFKDKIKGFDNTAQIYTAPKGGGSSKFISDGLKEALHENMLKNGASILIMNRLGYSGAYACLNCGALAKCKKCGAVLSRVQREEEDILSCKKCSAKESLAQICVKCKNEIFRPLGGGTQAVAEDLQKIFPQARIMRLDSQTLATKAAQGNYVAQALESGDVDIVVGTQMALRVGLLNSKVNLIAILDGDMQLNTLDFRTAEHFAQMLFNLKGRLNRVKNGKFIVQISDKNMFDFALLKENNYLKFADNELTFRKEFNYPPYTKIVKIVLTSKTRKDLNTYTQIILDAIKTAYSAFMEAQGPVQTGVQADKFYQQYLLVKSLNDAMLKGFLKTVADNKPPKQVAIKVVADPYNFM